MGRRGLLFVLSGPSGAGKGTVLDRVIQVVDNIAVSTSVTTRDPRPGEIDGLHYYFKTQEEFADMVQNDEFLEYVAKFKNKYGTPKAPVQKLLNDGYDVVLEIETNGAENIRKVFPEACFIFITPSSYAELARRLNTRGTETEESKQLRLKIAKREYTCMKDYSYVSINDDLDDCVQNVIGIIKAQRCALANNQELVENFFTLNS
ncbi:MAG: guanylate kinase [Bacillota bacterium]